MSTLFRALAGSFATILACTLPLEDKASCVDSTDCIEGRACIVGRCTDEACGLACGALCEARDECVSDRPCEVSCDVAGSELAALESAQCGSQYDLLASDSCEALTCFESCATTCTRGVECALIDEASVCIVQCQLDPNGCPTEPQGCNELDVGALRCWSRGDTVDC